MKTRYWLPAILYMVLIFILSSFPALEPVRELPIILQIKIAHLIEYGILGFLVWLALAKTTSLSRRQCYLWAIILSGAYGISDELHQAFVPERTARIVDVATNFMAAGIAQGIIEAGRRLLKKGKNLLPAGKAGG